MAEDRGVAMDQQEMTAAARGTRTPPSRAGGQHSIAERRARMCGPSLGRDHDDEPLWTLGDLVRYLRVSERTARRFVQSGTIPGVKVGSQWRFRPAEVRASLVPVTPIVTPTRRNRAVPATVPDDEPVSAHAAR